MSAHSWDFEKHMRQQQISLQRRRLTTLQVNLGKLCNQACQHCHVEASPYRTENMDRKTVDACLAAVDQFPIQTADLTGGAPELNPNFDYFVTELRKRNVHVIDRCNLTVFYEPGKSYLPEFLQAHDIEVVASLPCYSAENVKKQRGNGVFEKSIRALRELNERGYGRGKHLLNLVYNPIGPTLPPDQNDLETQYKRELKEQFGIDFDRLFTITNMPIKRFADFLERSEQYEKYLELLVNNFNVSAAKNIMCFELLSVGWDGKLYDCDFNQMLEIPHQSSAGTTIFDVTLSQLNSTTIATGAHCFGCTAGSGSSCTGAISS